MLYSISTCATNNSVVWSIDLQMCEGDSEVQIIQSNLSDGCVRLIRLHLFMADDPAAFGNFSDMLRGG